MVGLFLGVSFLGLTACGDVGTDPLTVFEDEQRARQDAIDMFANQEEISGPVNMETAIAYALKYDLDHRLKLMEEAVANDVLDEANMDLLPQLTVQAGYRTRSEDDATYNDTKTSISSNSDRAYTNSDLTLAWSLLDFGIGYYQAKQASDKAHIVLERRRQVIQNIVENTRYAYWQQVAAQRAKGRLARVQRDARHFIANADERIAARETPEQERQALELKRNMLQMLRRLEEIDQQFQSSKLALGALMNVPPGTDLAVADAAYGSARPVPRLRVSTKDLELAALRNRTELRSEAYQLRIIQQESRMAILEMLPGVSFSAGVNATSDSYKVNGDWYSAAANLSWNLFDVLRAPKTFRAIRNREELSKARRLALSMAVISQVNVAEINFQKARETYLVSQRLANVDYQLFKRISNDADAGEATELDVIRQRVAYLISQFEADLAYAEMQAAYGQIFVAAGADPLPTEIEDSSIDTLATGIKSVLDGWEKGRIQSPNAQLASASL